MHQLTANVPLVLAGLVATLAVTTTVHELGHLAMARVLRIPIRHVTVGLGPALLRRSLGVESELLLRAIPTGMTIGVLGRRDADGTLRRPIGHDILMAVAGPLMSFLLAASLLAAGCNDFYPYWMRLWFGFTAFLSAFLGAANLIPVPGLDGGHLLVLGAALVGLQASPEHEMMVHRVGTRLMAAACLLSLLVTLVIRYQTLF